MKYESVAYPVEDDHEPLLLTAIVGLMSFKVTETLSVDTVSPILYVTSFSWLTWAILYFRARYFLC